MRTILKSLLIVPIALSSLFAGGFRLEIGNPKANPAAKKDAVVLARLTSCQNPADAKLTVTAEGVVDGKRQTIALKADSLGQPGLWSINRTWPAEGKWVVNVLATHPQYGEYTSGFVVGVQGDSFDWGKVTHFQGKPATASDIAAILAK